MLPHWSQRPLWYAGHAYYWRSYPPAGYYYPTLPTGYTVVVIDGKTYYLNDGVYYIQTTKDGQKGYAVAPAPVPGGDARPAARRRAAGRAARDPLRERTGRLLPLLTQVRMR